MIVNSSCPLTVERKSSGRAWRLPPAACHLRRLRLLDKRVHQNL